MSSIIQGYTYDIFISYRQKDNKGDRWVSEFVDALKIELESTFKEEIDVYFDINPHDGLLETNDVEASLREKLKCLVFIPVISRTYCDPKSFAWEHEFLAFIETASADHFGLKIVLPNGNVTCRVLPVRIHDLDTADIKLCETALGGILRGVDFVYRSAGVNRPLLVNEAHPNDNLNKTYYRDQINKLANAIEEIIHSLKNGSPSTPVKEPSAYKDEKTKNKVRKRIRNILGIKRKTSGIMVILAILIVLTASFLFVRSQYLKNNAKTIAIIPLTNPPNDVNLARLAIGSMDAIITKLQEIKSLTVRGRISSLQYLDTKKTLNELRKELKVNYIVEINISRTGSNLKMWTGLTKTSNDKQLWANLYNVDEEQLMPLFTSIVQSLSGAMEIKFSGDEIISIEKDLTKNPEAYLNYLSASAKLLGGMGNKFLDSTNFKSVIALYDKAIQEDPSFASAYARRAIARAIGYHNKELNQSHIEKCWSDIVTATKINKELTDVEIAKGFYYYYCSKDYINALVSFNTASVRDPENYQPLFYMAMVYRALGDWDKVHALVNKVIQFNPQDPLDLTNIGLCFDYLHNYDSALIFHQKAINIKPEWSASYQNKITTLLLRDGNTKNARNVLDSLVMITHQSYPYLKILFDVYDGKFTEALNDAGVKDQHDLGSRGDMYINLADISTYMDRKDFATSYYDSAMTAYKSELKDDNNNFTTHGSLGRAYAALGNREKAIEEGKLAIDLTVAEKNKMAEDEMSLNLAQIYLTLGSFDEAINIIENSLKTPSLISVQMLKLDPSWKPLWNNPQFQNIIKKYVNI